jgi:hypothetical protein
LLKTYIFRPAGDRWRAFLLTLVQEGAFGGDFLKIDRGVIYPIFGDFLIQPQEISMKISEPFIATMA